MQIKVGDFGLACEDYFLFNSNNTTTVTSRSEVTSNDDSETHHLNSTSEHTVGVGTSLYASPEQLNRKSYNNKV